MASRDLDDLLNSILEEDGSAEKIKEMEDTILYPLLEEIDLLIDGSVKEFVRAVLVRAPESFWVAPASKSEELNPPDEHEEGGNITHVKRLVRCAIMLSDAQNYDPEEQDLLVAAALISNATKFLPIKDDYILDPMYPYTVDRFVQEVMGDEIKNMAEPASEGASTTLLISGSDIDAILRLVRCHMGRFSAIPETFPSSMAEWTLHFADILTTKMHYIIDGEDVEEDRWKL